jgi:hypothetical protein
MQVQALQLLQEAQLLRLLQPSLSLLQLPLQQQNQQQQLQR